MPDSDAVRVLVTGGGGFLGSHVVDALLKEGHKVAVLDSLVEQVHGPARLVFDENSEYEQRVWPTWCTTPEWKNVRRVWPTWCTTPEWKNVRLEYGDVRDRDLLQSFLEEFRPDCIVHLAAEVGVGQAEREIRKYVDTNVLGTATLLEAVIAANKTASADRRRVSRLVVAGSMSAYGEGMWFCKDHGAVRQARMDADVHDGAWLPICPHAGCKTPLEPSPTPEWASLRPAGVYAATKRDQEEYALLVGRSTGISVAVPRFFNLYGPRQSLTNPYTGACAIFASRCLSGEAPRVYEDGGQLRDFLHVTDAAAAVVMLVGSSTIRSAQREWAGNAFCGVFNVGSGVATSVLEVAALACDVIAPHLKPEVTGSFRIGDIRACVAEVSRMRDGLGWVPKVQAETGLRSLFESWKDLGSVADVAALDRAHNEAVAQGVVIPHAKAIAGGVE